MGDKVIQTRNNYDKDVFNGDIGRIYSFDMTNQIMTVRMDERLIKYDWSEADELAHAYCISVHRAQGSEYPCIVMPVVTQHYMMLQRNLLYTAVTRAKKLVVLVGTRKAIAIAVRNDDVDAAMERARLASARVKKAIHHRGHRERREKQDKRGKVRSNRRDAEDAEKI